MDASPLLCHSVSVLQPSNPRAKPRRCTYRAHLPFSPVAAATSPPTILPALQHLRKVFWSHPRGARRRHRGALLYLHDPSVSPTVPSASSVVPKLTLAARAMQLVHDTRRPLLAIDRRYGCRGARGGVLRLKERPGVLSWRVRRVRAEAESSSETIGASSRRVACDERSLLGREGARVRSEADRVGRGDA